MNKFYYTYKITLLKGSLAGHYYYGQHRTTKLNDGYAGSGRKIKDYYKKYGAIEGVTYVKSILQFYNSDEELNEAEKLLIGDKYKTDNLCLNLSSGGKTNKDFKFSEESRKKLSESHKGLRHSEETRKKMSESAKKRGLSEETRKKISESLKGHKSYNKNKHWKKDPETGKRIWY